MPLDVPAGIRKLICQGAAKKSPASRSIPTLSFTLTLVSPNTVGSGCVVAGRQPEGRSLSEKWGSAPPAPEVLELAGGTPGRRGRVVAGCGAGLGRLMLSNELALLPLAALPAT